MAKKSNAQLDWAENVLSHYDNLIDALIAVGREWTLERDRLAKLQRRLKVFDNFLEVSWQS